MSRGEWSVSAIHSWPTSRPAYLDRLRDGFGGGRAYPGQRLQRALTKPLIQFAGRQIVHHLGRPPEGPHAVGRRTGPLELERDLPQCLCRIHLSFHTARAGRRPGGWRPTGDHEWEVL